MANASHDVIKCAIAINRSLSLIGVYYVELMTNDDVLSLSVWVWTGR